MVLARCCIAAVLALPVFVFCQSESPSLGDVARQSRAAHPSDTTKAKHVIENDEVDAHKGPIPEISLTQVSNAPQIIAAIRAYGEKHSDQETEAIVRDWYDNEMTIVHAAVNHSITLYQDRFSPGTSNTIEGQRYYDDYRKAAENQRSNLERENSDLKALGDYNLVISRISSGLREVKTGIESQKRYQYAWFEADYPTNRRVFMPTRPQTQVSTSY